MSSPSIQRFGSTPYTEAQAVTSAQAVGELPSPPMATGRDPNAALPNPRLVAAACVLVEWMLSLPTETPVQTERELSSHDAMPQAGD